MATDKYEKALADLNDLEYGDWNGLEEIVRRFDGEDEESSALARSIHALGRLFRKERDPAVSVLRGEDDGDSEQLEVGGSYFYVSIL